MADNELPVSLVDQAGARARVASADYDTGGGTVTQAMIGIAVPASGGPVPAGTASNPLRTDPVGTTAQPLTGNVAHDDADAGNPLKVGAKAIAHGASPTPVAANDRTDLYANRHGILWVIGGHPNVATIRANYTTAQDDTAIVTAGSGEKIVVTRVMVCADHANTVDVAVRIGFGAANTPTGAGVVAAHPGIDPGGGFVAGNGGGILGIGADAEDLRIDSEVPTSGSIDVTVSYYIVPS